jgi:hypothetical protein
VVLMCISNICHAEQMRADAGTEQAAPPSSQGGGIWARQQARSEAIVQQLQSQNHQEQARSTGLQWSADGSRPSLNYKLDDNSSLKLRPSRRGLRIMYGKEF